MYVGYSSNLQGCFGLWLQLCGHVLVSVMRLCFGCSVEGVVLLQC